MDLFMGLFENMVPTREIRMTDASSIASKAFDDNARLRPIYLWLFAMCAIVALMVIVGGATRLTDSGLSITEWKPIVGSIPPLSQAAWLLEFEKYQQIPEYSEVNFGMSLSEFKEIYWWEWGHRFLGRFIGIAFFIPMMIFMLTKRAVGVLRLHLFGLFLLGGAQGALGWYMVKSGLSDRVDVSQYRLAAHLGLAVLLFALMAWLAFSLRQKTRPLYDEYGEGLGNQVPLMAIITVIAVYGQIILGAFVAGLRAGRTYNSWPLMDGKFIPDAYFNAGPRFLDLFESIAAVQFNHRLGAYLVLVWVVWFFINARKTALSRQALWVLLLVGGQAILGITTLVLGTPLWLGLLHQGGALVVLFVALYTAFCAKIMSSDRGIV